MITGVQEAGCDEAGRGCFAGPVFAAAVILPDNYTHDSLTDSKAIKEKLRHELREQIEADSVSFCVASVDSETIDRINILNASILAMHKALGGLKIAPGHIIVDGNRFKKYGNISHMCVVKGDGKYLSIAAASILAKTYRDDFMKKIHAEFPQYAWDENKGYGTEKHRKAILSYGLSPYHRKSFKLSDKQLEMKFQ